MFIAKLIFSTMRKLIVLLLLTIPSLALAIDLEGYYITAKGGASKTFNTGATSFDDGNTINQFAYKLSAGTLFSLTEQLSLDVNYQYVNLGAFKSGVRVEINGVFAGNLVNGVNGGEIKTQELMVGLQYKF